MKECMNCTVGFQSMVVVTVCGTSGFELVSYFPEGAAEEEQGWRGKMDLRRGTESLGKTEAGDATSKAGLRERSRMNMKWAVGFIMVKTFLSLLYSQTWTHTCYVIVTQQMFLWSETTGWITGRFKARMWSIVRVNGTEAVGTMWYRVVDMTRSQYDGV